MKVDVAAWKKWQGWAERIYEDFRQVVEDRDIHEGFREVVQENGDWIDSNEGGLFIDFVKRNYVSSAFMGVRRQLKVDDDSISLMRLLGQMAAQAHQITFDFYMTIFPFEAEQDKDGWVWQRETFRSFTTDGKTVSAEMIQADALKARTLAAEIEKAADRTVAHNHKGDHKSNVTFDDLRASIHEFDELACRYIGFLTGKGWTSCGPSIVFNWRRVFDHPFRKPTT